MFHRTAGLVLAAAVTTAGCGTGTAGQQGGSETTEVVAAFYPLAFVAERVGGDEVTVTNLTKPGAEPHDLELAPQAVARISGADLVLHLEGFQPAVDEAITAEAADRAMEVGESARLGLDGAGDEHAAEENPDDEHADEKHAGDEEHAEEEHAEEEHGHGATDPHFWLDPTRLADVADAVARRLAEVAPQDAEAFQANAAALRADLESLDSEMAEGLATCTSTDLVTGHTAFAYLADRYGLHQVGISGLSAHGEPSAQELAEVAAYVEEHDVSTVYYEPLVSPDLARTVAAETGAATAVLDPVEGLTDESAGQDYLAVMRANLATLREGQQCA